MTEIVDGGSDAGDKYDPHPFSLFKGKWHGYTFKLDTVTQSHTRFPRPIKTITASFYRVKPYIKALEEDRGGGEIWCHKS